MKLFDGFAAIRFQEENLIFITHNSYLYYIYDPKYKRWSMYRNAGNDSITVSKYHDISKGELTAAMDGKFPTKETDFMRLCHLSELCIRDMLSILSEDYPDYMYEPENFFATQPLYSVVHHILLQSDVRYKSYEKIRELLDNAMTDHKTHEEVIESLKKLSLKIIGRDIFKAEIGIVDGHDSSSYFWIMPVRVLDSSNTDETDNVAEMRSVEISIEEDDVAQYLTPFLYQYFDKDLDANKHRSDADDFEWYLTRNFYTYESTNSILADIKDTVDALSTGRVTEYTTQLKVKRGTASNELIYAKDLTAEQVATYNENRPQEDDTSIELIIDFYNRFVYRMEYMMKVGKEKGYDLISFMGP